METINNDSELFSFEFYPPKTEEGQISLLEVIDKLAVAKPEFFSVTFGAGGSTRDKTFDTVMAINAKGYSAAPHLSCVASTKENIKAIFFPYQVSSV